MLKGFAKLIAYRAGLEVRRAPDPTLPTLRTITCDGAAFRFWIANQHAKSWWDKPVLDMTAELRSLKKMCSPGSVVLDVGAHHGMDSVLLARWTQQSGHVYGLEANPENAMVLDANIAANQLANCTGVHTAVGASSGTLRIVDETVDDRSPLARTVPLTTLDDFCRDRSLKSVGLVKIDVEGYEGQVLRGAGRLLAQRPAIALELHLDSIGRYGDTADDILGRLKADGYHVTMMVRPDWQTLHQFRGAQDLPPSGVVNLFLESG